MNKWQKQTQQHLYKNEKELLEELKRLYRQSLTDINVKIAGLLGRTDIENLSSIIYQVDYQKALKTQIKAILDSLYTNNFKTISEYLGTCYNDAFIGTLYDLQMQGIPLLFPIDQDQVVKAIKMNSKIKEGLYKKLGLNVDEFKKQIVSEVSRGISQTYSYQEIARNLKNVSNADFNKTYRIARTEGHRIQQEATYDCQCKAKDNGAEIVKQWDATLDGKTRPDHIYLDGQIKEMDEYFEVNGHKALYPSGFGVAKEDINCRCCLLQRAKWAIENTEKITKMDSKTGKLVSIKANTYDEFKNKYWGEINDNSKLS
ncbi:MAG: phage head morphogenesis protein [Methanobrevibacter sp.]|uniref:phage minor head protein n=1 Tax=Methanobrevibacter sp. TaxID=66852 RepID=UPI0031F58949|nr:phage head morphogenesis protein [Methanobrevibacter sp.]